MHWTTVAARPKQHWSGAGYTEAPCLSVGWDDRPVRRAVARALVTDRGVHGEVAGGVGPGRVGLDDRVAGPGAPSPPTSAPPPCYPDQIWAADQEGGGLPGRIRPAALVENPHRVQRDVRRGPPLHPNGTVGAADEDVEVGGRRRRFLPAFRRLCRPRSSSLRAPGVRSRPARPARPAARAGRWAA